MPRSRSNLNQLPNANRLREGNPGRRRAAQENNTLTDRMLQQYLQEQDARLREHEEALMRAERAAREIEHHYYTPPTMHYDAFMRLDYWIDDEGNLHQGNKPSSIGKIKRNLPDWW